MKAGELRHKVTFFKPRKQSTVSDIPDQKTMDLSQIGDEYKKVQFIFLIAQNIPAKIRLVSIKEIQASEGLFMQSDIAIECRYNSKLEKLDNRCFCKSASLNEPFQILAWANPDFRKKTIKIICRRVSIEKESDFPTNYLPFRTNRPTKL